MAGSTASKKVARAARTGGGGRRNFNANLGFYALLLVLALIGTGLVGYSRSERINEVSGGSPPRAQEGQEGGDRWYSAYGFYLCDKFADPINNPADPFGFSTQNDGIIYIHPYERAYSGSNANLGAFARSVDIQIDRDSFKLPGSETEYIDGETKCGDQPGQMVVKVWSDANDPESGEIREGDPNRILLKDGQAITVAFVPNENTEIPLPPSVPALEQAPAKDAAAAQGGGAGGAVPTQPGQEGIATTPQSIPAGATPDGGAAPAPAAPAAPAPDAPAGP